MNKKFAVLAAFFTALFLVFITQYDLPAYADDPPTISFSSSTASVNEGDDVILTVVLSEAYEEEVSVIYATIDVTANEESDYNEESGLLTIRGGQTSAQIVISTLTDYENFEGDETFNVVLFSHKNASLGPPSTATVTINDVETFPPIYIDSYDSPVDEGDECSVLIKLWVTAERDTTVDYTTSDGTAVAGSDYTETSGTLTIPAGYDEGYINIPTTSDTEYESDETFTLTLSNPVRARLLGTSSATITIANVLPELDFSSDAIEVSETDGEIIIPVNLSYAMDRDVSFDYSTSDNTAEAGLDYTAVAGTVIISQGDTTGYISVPILDDSIYEYSESFYINLSNPVNAAIETSSKAVKIINDDSKRVFSFDEATVSVDEYTKIYSIPYTWKGGSVVDARVSFAIEGTATEGGSGLGDFALGVVGLSKSASDSTETGLLSFRVNADTRYEGDETFTIIAYDPWNCTIENGSVTVTIEDNDNPPQIYFSYSSYEVDEDAGTAEVRVRLSESSGKDAIVDYYCTSGTATDGSDYIAQTGTLTIPLNTLGKYISIELPDDEVYEGDESFTVTISNPQNATLGARAQTTVTILENDPEPVASLGKTTYYIDEGGSGNVKIQLDRPSTSDIVIGITSIDGTAEKGSDKDYLQEVTQVTIPAGELSAEAGFTANDNSLYAKDKYFNVEISAISGGVDIGTDRTKVVISDDDPKPKVSFSATQIMEDEDDVVIAIVELDAISGEDVLINYSTADGTAGASKDYLPNTSGLLTILAGQRSGTIFIDLIDDALYDNGDETFTVTLSKPRDAELGSDSVATVTIKDNESAPQAEFETTSLDFNEDKGTFDIKVNMTGSFVDEDVNIKYELVNGTATGGQDFVFDIGTVIIPEGETSGTISVEILDDSLYDNGDEAFTIKLSDPDGAQLGADDEAEVTIHDNETMPTLGFSPTSVTVNESAGKTTLTIKLTGKSDEQISIKFATSNGTASAGRDYTPKSGTLYIYSGNDSATMQVSITNDTADEKTETLYLTLSDPKKALLGTSNKATISITDNDEPAPTDTSTDDKNENSQTQSKTTSTPAPTPTFTPEPTASDAMENTEEASPTTDDKEQNDGDETGDNTPGNENPAPSVTVVPEAIEVNNETKTVTVTINRADLGENAAGIRLPSGGTVDLSDETGDKVQLEVSEDDINEDGDIELLIIDDNEIALGSYNIDLTDDANSLFTAKSSGNVLIWVAVLAAVVGLLSTITVLRKRRR